MPGHHSPRPRLITQKTKNALAKLPGIDSLAAARLCNIRQSPVNTVTKQDLIESLFVLFDAVRPIVEQIHEVNTRRAIDGTLDSMVQLYKDRYATEEL